MPLSTVLGAQSLVQPAVCTTAGRPASPYTGQAIYDTTLSQVLVYNGTAFAPVSRIVQVVQATFATATASTSSSFVTSGLNASITPTLNTSKVLVMVTMPTRIENSSGAAICTLFRGTVAGTNLTTTNGFGKINGGNDFMGGLSFNFLDSPATTSATTYTVGFRSSAANNAVVQVEGATSSITLMEISV